MNYLLMLKFVTPSGDRCDWEIYSNEENARIALTRYIKQSEQYQGFPIGPILVQHLILEVKEVTLIPERKDN